MVERKTFSNYLFDIFNYILLALIGDRHVNNYKRLSEYFCNYLWQCSNIYF